MADLRQVQVLTERCDVQPNSTIACLNTSRVPMCMCKTCYAHKCGRKDGSNFLSMLMNYIDALFPGHVSESFLRDPMSRFFRAFQSCVSEVRHILSVNCLKKFGEFQQNT